jgi:mannose-6-phosphate isomerase-like protein (cupin superfamily)
MSYIAPILKLAKENENFRTVLYTGQKSQLVLMAIPVGGDIGEEVHHHVEQVITLVEGEALSVLDGVKRERCLLGTSWLSRQALCITL